MIPLAGNNPLVSILDEVWRRLARACGDPSAACHAPALGTSDGVDSHTRTVILRAVNLEHRTVMCYTDSRSSKVQQLAQFPRASWLFYDLRDRVQIRLEGQVTLHTDDPVAERAWAATTPANRARYGGPSPGSQAMDTDDVSVQSRETRADSVAEDQDARRCFAVVCCQVDRIDWLDLRIPGHRRAQFEWRDGIWLGRRVAP